MDKAIVCENENVADDIHLNFKLADVRVSFAMQFPFPFHLNELKPFNGTSSNWIIKQSIQQLPESRQ